MMRTRITLFLALVLTAVGTLTARAQEAYAALSDDNTTLTFYYDALKESRGGMDIGPFDAPNGRGWDAQCESITTAVFRTDEYGLLVHQLYQPDHRHRHQQPEDR